MVYLRMLERKDESAADDFKVVIDFVLHNKRRALGQISYFSWVNFSISWRMLALKSLQFKGFFSILLEGNLSVSFEYTQIGKICLFFARYQSLTVCLQLLSL